MVKLLIFAISLFRYFTICFVGGGGFEPPKAAPTDLQSAPFDRSGIPPDSTMMKS